jgi:hypothetical protein
MLFLLLPRATKLGSSFTYFFLLFFKGVNLNHFEFFFLDIISELIFEKFILTTFLGMRRMISFKKWWKKG